LSPSPTNMMANADKYMCNRYDLESANAIDHGVDNDDVGHW